MQRGNNRLPCFLDDGDRLRYLHLLRDALYAIGCQLHVYVLMDNHVHLLATPPATGWIGQLMQRLGHNVRGAVQWRPRAHRHTMGRPLQSLPFGQRGLRPSRLSLY
ncbi:transposase [Xanthomonas sp. WHRI 6108]|uniref:transposase n=1 Tax=Xanthomonas TaxID=338 RepID=UPI0021A8CDF6|nr:transposase [Xanthomonas arboricola]